MLYEDVRRCIEENALIKKGDTVGIAVSGGADSVALAFLLSAMGKREGFQTVILHYEHGIRGEESLRDMSFVKKFAEGMSVPIIIEQGNVPEEAQGESLESVARRMRYEFFIRTMREKGLASIAVAHHLEDLAETLVMNLVRGSGLDGLTAMRPKREPGIIRPMLYVRKQEILDFIEKYRLPFVYDSSNDSVEFTRNFVRSQVMPQLREINPAADESIARAYLLLRDDLDLLRAYTDREFARVAECDGRTVSIDLTEFNKLPVAMQRRIIRRAIGSVASLIDIEKHNVDQIVRLAQADRTGKYTKKNNVLAVVAYHRLKISQCPSPSREDMERPELPLVQVVELESCEAAPEAFPKSGELTQYVDGDQLKGAVVRTRRDGDVFQPLGMEGTKKLSDWFIDKKVPREQRDAVPLVAKGAEVLWIVGMALSDRVKICDATDNIVKITFCRELINEQRNHASGHS